tara:strand:+ start:252 stop:536 length:285 start_codon:yes stop_codon:yes gene_type:complete
MKNPKKIDINSSEFKFAVNSIKESNIKKGKTNEEVKSIVNDFLNYIKLYNSLSEKDRNDVKFKRKEKFKKDIKTGNDEDLNIEDLLLNDLISRH